MTRDNDQNRAALVAIGAVAEGLTSVLVNLTNDVRGQDMLSGQKFLHHLETLTEKVAVLSRCVEELADQAATPLRCNEDHHVLVSGVEVLHRCQLPAGHVGDHFQP